jgi:hypothetical protein
MKKGYILGGAALVGAVAFTQYRDFKAFQDSLQFAVKNVKIDSATANAITLRFNLVITNPVKYSVQAKSLNVNLSFNDKLIARAFRLTPFEIKAESLTTIPAKFTIPYNSAIPGIIALFTNFLQTYTVPLNASGVINLGLFSAKFSTNFNII